MKKILKIILISLLSIIIFSAFGYILLGYYYRDGFSYGTYINGLYCTGLSPKSVNAIISKNDLDGDITISYEDNVFTLDKASINFNTDYLMPLKQYKDVQNPYLWIENLSNESRNREIKPQYSYNKEALEKELYRINLDKIGEPHTINIIETEDGYDLYNGKVNELDINKCLSYIDSKLLLGQTDIALDKSCLSLPSYTKEDENTFILFDAINEYVNKTIEFDFSIDKIKLTNKELISLLEKDSNGYPYLNDKGLLDISDESIENGIVNILNEYNTYHNHIFTCSSGESVYIDSGTYGNEFDVNKEALKLIEAFNEGFDEYSSEIELKNTAKYLAKNDIGDTYLEISLDDQHWWYYKDGELLLETDIVTGNRSRRCDTPEGVYYVYYMQRNRTLVGANYRSFVKYWIAFNKHIGVHDASWRDEYGGDIYLTSGSHGCVNTPEDICKKLYEIIEIGTPVIVYSKENSRVDNNIL